MTGLPPSHGVLVRLQRVHRVSVQARPLTISLAASVAALAMTTAATLSVPAAAGTPTGTAVVTDDRAGGDTGSAPPGRRWLHSSDGERGELATGLPLRRGMPAITKVRDRWQVAPGVRVKVWDAKDSRGKIRAYLTTVRLDQPGVRLDYLTGEHITDREPVSDLVSDQGAIVGVNGDFFDIGDTGAPLGFAAGDRRPMRSAPRYGWPKTFQVDREGKPSVGDASMVARVDDHRIGLSNVNPPNVPVDGIALYTPQWGQTLGSRITDGQRKRVREVWIKGGVVVSNRGTLSKGERIRGRVLVARGATPAKRLRDALPVGEKVEITREITGRPSLAIGGSAYLLQRGKVVTRDDGELHPRTAVGIDRDTNRIFLLVVDGRQKFSRGLTLLELARMLKRLGAEDALNLDGGGSSTMVAEHGPELEVVNSPSDGWQRLVPNGIGVFYDKPVKPTKGTADDW